MEGTGYSATVNAVAARIEALIPDNPHIMGMTSAWDLFKVPGFDVSDLNPSLMQAEYGLALAKQNIRKKEPVK